MGGDLIGLIAILLIVGVVLYFFPIDGTVKNIILCLILIAVIVTLFHGFGGLGSGAHWRW